LKADCIVGELAERALGEHRQDEPISAATHRSIERMLFSHVSRPAA